MIKSIKNYLSQGIKQFKPLFYYWVLFICIGAIFRIIHLFNQTKSDSINDLFGVFAYGIRMDTIAFCALFLITIWFYLFGFLSLMRLILLAAFTIYLIIEFATIGFLDQFSSRPNYLFIEHLGNYKEIFTMVYELYMVQITLAVIILLGVLYYTNKMFKHTMIHNSLLQKLSVFPLVIVILFLGMRSSIDASTPNQGFYTFSKSNIHNEIANNSIFSILYATYLLKKEVFYEYGDISLAQVFTKMKQQYSIEDLSHGLNRVQNSNFTNKKHVVLVILESFGAQHIGHLGGTPTTPNLDELTKHAFYCTNMQAVGTRTSWGVSSILTGLYPLSSREYIKAPRSQKNFYTIAKTFKEHSYKNIFLYSGDADFDNMKGFMLSNGYDYILDKHDFETSLQKYTWGYCDEDLYNKAISILEKSKNEKVFLTLLTLSSHEPFDYPLNKTSLYDQAPVNSFANSIKYADYAIGRFIQMLKEKDLLKDTVIGFIADHANNAHSNFDIPVEKYKIASMILSQEFFCHPIKYEKIASQIDFGPTLLQIAGIDATIPTMGQSMLKTQNNHALVVANYKNYGLLLDDHFVVFKPNKQINSYNYQFQTLPNIQKDIDLGLSYIYTSKYLYDNNLYK